MRYPYAVFDLDGTLLDSMPYWSDLGARYLRTLGFVPPADLGRILAGLTMTEGAEYVRSTFGIAKTTEEIVEEIYGLVRQAYAEEIQAKPGLKAFLERLKKAGVQMCIATASEAGLAESALKRLGLWDYFSFVLDCGECGSGKRSPDIFDQAAARLGGSRENTLIFEDAYHAVCTAHAAGYYVVGVRDASQGSAKARLRAVCDAFIEDFAEAKCVWEQEETDLLRTENTDKHRRGVPLCPENTGRLRKHRRGVPLCPENTGRLRKGVKYMKASVAIQVLPAVQDQEQMLKIVDAVIAYIRGTGLSYEVGPFETTIEGDDYDQLMEIVKNCQLVAVENGCEKVSAYVKIVYRPEGGVLTIDEKTGKYEEKALAGTPGNGG